jgi:hypothetical protein
MPSPLRGSPIVTEWRDEDVRHACRCAKLSQVHIENEAAFLLELRRINGWTMQHLIKDTLMSADGYAWLIYVCAGDGVARSGVEKMKKVRRLIVNEIFKQARHGR